MELKNYLQDLADPLSGKPLQIKDGSLVCDSSSRSYPLVLGIPWLFPFPLITHHEWAHKTKYLLQNLLLEIKATQQSLDNKLTLNKSLTRLKLLKEAYIHNLDSYIKILTPFSTEIPLENDVIVHTLNPNLQLVGYERNIFRDWVWGEKENQLSLDEIKKVWPTNFPNQSKVLVLGSGSGRLTYDLALSFPEIQFLACDINPYLMFIFQSILENKNLSLYEIHYPAISPEEVTHKHTLTSPQDIPKNISLVLGDALSPPFPRNRFDMVLTPWLIDVIDQPLSSFMKTINWLLKPDGIWIQHGPLLFDNCPQTDRLTFSEVLELTKKMGFHVLNQTQIETPYLADPLVAHKRYERLYTFGAKKTQHKEKATFESNHIPEWAHNPKLPIPLDPLFVNSRLEHQILNQVLSQIDGQKSIEDIVELLINDLKLPREYAKAFFTNYLLRLIGDHNKKNFVGVA